MRAPTRACRRAIPIALVLAAIPAVAARSATAPSGLAYSSDSARVVQRQPSPGMCRATGAGLYLRPDPHCTPGALNPAVTQASIGSTICMAGWTSSVRPSEAITEAEKRSSMRAYGDSGSASRFEYDHDVPLELGGAVNDPRNLWPEPNYAEHAGFYLNPKDRLETALKRLVCSGSMPLSTAQHVIASDWVSAFHKYG
jgi:hypothetical protein